MLLLLLVLLLLLLLVAAAAAVAVIVVVVVIVAVVEPVSVELVRLSFSFTVFSSESFSANCLALKWQFDFPENIVPSCYKEKLVNILYKVLAVYFKNNVRIQKKCTCKMRSSLMTQQLVRVA